MEKMEQIIVELKQKNYASFDEFYNLTKNQVFYAIVAIIKDRMLAEDLLQDTYLKFLEKIDQYQLGSNVYAYLSQIGRNLAINLYNRRKKEFHNDEIIEQIPAQEESKTDDEEIFKLLDYLDIKEREIIVLHVINDLTFREISEITKKPLGTVLWIYNKAIKKLKGKVGEQYE
jgi:RNA polymerase sigma-70 factor (ECF subfamily)